MSSIRIRTGTFELYILSYIFTQQIHQVCLLLLPSCYSHPCSASLQPRRAEQPWPCSRVGRLAVFPDLAPSKPCWSFNVSAGHAGHLMCLLTQSLALVMITHQREWADKSQETQKSEDKVDSCGYLGAQRSW